MSRILIIEDEPLIARDLKRIIENNGYTVSDICYNSDLALDRLSKQDFDIVLLDIHLKGSRNGIELAKIINEKYEIPFIYITSFADRDTIQQVKMTMPAGYVVKPFSDKEIYSAVEIALYKNDLQKDEPLTRDIINSRFGANLTIKEWNVIQGIMDGQTNAQMASIHYVSPNTIKSHIKNIYTKLDVHGRAGLVFKVMG